MKIEIRY